MEPTKEIVVEASSLQLPPGHWPLKLNFAGWWYAYQRVDRDRENDIIAVHYEGSGRKLVVLND